MDTVTAFIGRRLKWHALFDFPFRNGRFHGRIRSGLLWLLRHREVKQVVHSQTQ